MKCLRGDVTWLTLTTNGLFLFVEKFLMNKKSHFYEWSFQCTWSFKLIIFLRNVT